MGNLLSKTTQGYSRYTEEEEMAPKNNNKRRRTWSSPLGMVQDAVHHVLTKKQKKAAEDVEEISPGIPIDIEQVSNVGSVINARYQVQEILGSGSFGMVLKVKDVINDSTVALKVCKEENGEEDFIKEGNTLLRLMELDAARKYNIVQILEVFNWESRHFFTMELLTQSLAELLFERLPNGLEMNETRNISYQILESLDFLSKQRIVHCDLKPSNIMIKDPRTLEIKIIDFGSSEPVSSLAKYLYFTTRYYRSPEVILGLPYSSAIDIWSLGCIIVEMITGDALFRGENESDQINRIVEVLGLPTDLMLLAGTHTYTYFRRTTTSRRGVFYTLPVAGRNYGAPGSLSLEEILAQNIGEDDGAVQDERVTSSTDGIRQSWFLDLVEKMLVYDSTKRITAEQAKQHILFHSLQRKTRLPVQQVVRRAFEYFSRP